MESTDTANSRSSPGLSADLMHLYQTPQPLQMTPVQLNTELGAPSSQVTVLSVSQHFMLFTHTSSGAALLPVLAKDSCCFLALCWHLPTASNSQKDTFLCSSLCPVLLAVGSKRTSVTAGKGRPWGPSSKCARDMGEDESQWFIT